MTDRTLANRVARLARRAVFPSLRALDTVLQRAVPVTATRVVYASTPDYADSAHSMYRHLLETRRGLEHVWLLRNMGLADRIRQEFVGSEARGHSLVIRPWTPRSYLTFLRARYVIHTHGLYGFSRPMRGRTSVCVWHGMPVKAIRRLHTGDQTLFPVHGTVHLATSSFFRYMIASVFDVHPDQVLVSGLPRADVLKGMVPPGHSRQQIAERLGIDPGRRWLLWLPTHRSEADPRTERPARTFLDAIPAELVSALDDAAGDDHTEVIVKLHPFDLLNRHDRRPDHRNIRLLTASEWESTGVQLYDLVAASDALITDVSSVFIDYLHTGNPIGVIGFDVASYTRELLFDHDLLLRCRAARSLSTVDDVRHFVAGIRLGAETSPTDESAEDLSVVFNEDQQISSSAFVADAIGL